MNAEILAVGTELLLGNILNTNARYLSERLPEAGINVYYQSVCGDNPQRLKETLSLALSRSDMVITTGGLGPTYDDLTKETVAEALGLRLVLHEPSLRLIEQYMASLGREMTPIQRKQAMQPEGATVFRNDWGTAPACAVEARGKVVILLPGPPREMEPLFEHCVLPWLAKFSEGVLLSHTVHIFGVGEAEVEEILSHLLRDSVNPTVAPYAKQGEVQLRVSAKAGTREAAEALIAPAIEAVRAELGDHVYGIDVGSLQAAVVALLRERGLKPATAESCTAGLLSKRITEIPGASEVFECGVTSYANRIKHELLGVSEQTLREFGAVSEPVACQMAEGVRRLAGADIGVGITGLAGPGGGSTEKPVGLVYVALSTAGGTEAKRLMLARVNPDRENIRYLASSNALDMVRRALMKQN